MNYGLGEIIFIVIFVGATISSVIATIIAVIDIIKGDFRDPRDKRKWLYIVVATGIVGAVVYYYVGRKQVHAMTIKTFRPCFSLRSLRLDVKYLSHAKSLRTQRDSGPR